MTFPYRRERRRKFVASFFEHRRRNTRENKAERKSSTQGRLAAATFLLPKRLSSSRIVRSLSQLAVSERTA